MAGRKKVVKVETFGGLDIFVAEESALARSIKNLQDADSKSTHTDAKVNPGTEVHRLSLEEEDTK